MNEKQIERTLKDYRWMLKEIKRQRVVLEEEIGSKLVASSGIESTLPKTKGKVSDPVGQEVLRREKKSGWIIKLERKVLFIQERMIAIEDPREKAILECILDGMTISAVSEHMGLSRRQVYHIKDDIVRQIAHFTHSAQ
ncbi:helix-turn-helix domain-containing protein [Oceanobacillus manasiensis]|uniref:helix-turn-helix domain-containing protein n=1 Tax=Oceanobacillus manasiensis TaxID=586413 RepID=UPI0005A67420|nr:helix-turn-helix domain-containing protein [Oceanobacillus manasiensis]